MSQEKPPTGFPEAPDPDLEDHTGDPEPHHALNNPVGEPDSSEWPDPYERRPDPRDPASTDAAPKGAGPNTVPESVSTSEPNPKQDPEAEPWAEGPQAR